MAIYINSGSDDFHAVSTHTVCTSAYLFFHKTCLQIKNSDNSGLIKLRYHDSEKSIHETEYCIINTENLVSP